LRIPSSLLLLNIYSGLLSYDPSVCSIMLDRADYNTTDTVVARVIRKSFKTNLVFIDNRKICSNISNQNKKSYLGFRNVNIKEKALGTNVQVRFQFGFPIISVIYDN
jgi:hypothetical protein